MLKTIKKIGFYSIRTVANLFEIVFFFSLVLIFFIRSDWVQTQLAVSLAEFYSYELDTDVSIESVKINGFEYAEINGFYIGDRHNDTLLYIPHINGSLADLSVESKFVILSGINAEGARLKIQKYTGEPEFNLQFLINYFSSEEDESSSFTMKIKEVNLNKSHITYYDWNKELKEYGVDYDHLDLWDVSGKIIEFRNRGDVTTMNVEGLALTDRSGFRLDSLNAHILVNSRKIKLDKLLVKTPCSNVVTKGVELNFSGHQNFSNFVEDVRLFANVEMSSINMKDISYFVPSMEAYDFSINLITEIEGPINDLNLSSLFISVSEGTYFDGDISLKGLPNLDSTQVALNINRLQTSKMDLETVDLMKFGLMENVDIPRQVSSLGGISVTGNSNGYYHDFDISLDIITDIGAATGSFACNIDTAKELNYDGYLSTAGIDLSTLTNSSVFGNFTSDLTIKGKGLTIDDLDVVVDGHLNKFDLQGYTYDEVNINGHFKEKSFDGFLNVADQNIDLNFEGNIDLNKAPYDFSFATEVIKANPYDLHLINTRETASACFNLMAEGSGTNIDDFTGLVYFTDVAYFQEGTDYSFESIMLESKGNTNYHTIDIFSEFANISMEGEFNLDSIKNSLSYLGAKVLPSLFPNAESFYLTHEEFNLGVQINDLSKLTELFFPRLRIAPATALSCDYVSEDDALELFVKSDWIEYGDMRFAGIQLDTTQRISGLDLFYTLDLTIDSLFVSEEIYIQNVNLIAKAYEDNIGTNIYWSADDSSYWGKIYGDGYIMSSSEFEFDIHPSEIFSSVGMWHIDRDAHVRVDSTALHLDKIIAKNEDQLIKFDGIVSQIPGDKINFEIAGFNLNNISALTNLDTMQLDGSLFLDGYASNLYEDGYLSAYSLIEDLSINGYYTGNIETSTSWNANEQRMELIGELTRSNDVSDFVISKGHYYVNRPDNNLDFQFDFKNTDLTFVNAFMPEGVALEGNTKGAVYLKGEVSNPQFKGSLFLNETAVQMDMLNVKYTANGQVLIEPDMVLLNGFPLMDKYGSEALVVGSFFHQNFEKYSYDFFATFDKPFQVLNTNYNMNPLYYGDAFVSGDLSINYEDILDITINAKTEKGTNITLPLYGSEDVVLKEFVTFVNKEISEEEYKVDLEGINLNLSMDLTEEAEIQLVFDEVVGDAMRATGAGHIDMYIDKFYDFSMFGNYEVSEGSYLFTLKDFINKKFQVKPGSSISWYGDPYSADLDIKAYYPLKASLYDIMPRNDREGYKQKVDIECIMHLTQNLFNPNIGFDVSIPRSDENAKSVLRNLVSTEQEMNKQVFSLLILNKFLPRSDVEEKEGDRLGFVETATSEVLSNQLSNMISNFSDDFDLGFNYRPGDEISNDEVAVAMSTQLFNDKLTVKTNVGVSHENESSGGNSNSSLIGDVDVEYKLNPPEGNLRVHAFNESNEYDIAKVDQGNYTQGVGLFYQESFDNAGELFCKLANLFRFGDNNCTECQDKESRESWKAAKKEKSAAKKSKVVEIEESFPD